MGLFDKYGGLKKKDHEVMSAKEILVEGIDAQKKLLRDGEHLNKTEYELNRSKKIWFKDGRFAPYVGQYLLFEDKALDYPKGEELEVLKELEGAIAQHDKELMGYLRKIDTAKREKRAEREKIRKSKSRESKEVDGNLSDEAAS
tara:strand:- start:295 stop:726 length:432 start_codon:yes stop_codon:yes gene_type:complete